MGIFNKLFGGGGSNKGGGHRLIEMVDMMKNDLNLNADQIQKIQGFVQQFKQDRMNVKAQGGDKTQVNVERKELKEQIMSILTDEQKQKLMTNMAKYRESLMG